ncbi:MAG: ATP-binding protein [Firmicutes bacterium]|nr:ATP-binding protein [Bacillota bacterium]
MLKEVYVKLIDMKEILELDNFLTIQNVCSICYKKNRMMGIIGYPGAGKTIALEVYTKHHKNVYYVRVRKSMSTKDFYMRLLECMGVENTMRDLPPHFIMNKIAFNLNLNRKNNLIIIDEAGKFKPGQLEYIHELRDLTVNTTGIILAGPEYFKDNLDKWKKESVIGIPELHRRIHSFVDLVRPTKREVTGICKHHGITNPTTIKRLFKDSDNFGSLINQIELEMDI